MKPMLAGAVEYVIGVDTHRDSHTAAVVEAATGGVVEHLTVPTDAFGYRRLIAFADQHTHGRRVWAIEGTGSYGSGLTTSLLERGEWVVEIDRPARPARRDGSKSDDLDAVRAPGRRWPGSTSRAPVRAATGKPCGCSLLHARVRSWPAPRRSDS